MKSITRVVEKYNGTMQMYFDDKSKVFHTVIIIEIGTK